MTEGRKIIESPSDKSPTASYPPPLRPSIVAYMQHHPATPSTSTAAQHQQSQATRNINLPLCLPFAVIVTLLDVSLEQDAHLPLSLSAFSSLCHSAVCLWGIIQ